MRSALLSLTKVVSSTGIQQSLLVIGGTMAATSLSAISLIIVSRILGPTLFGEFSVGLAIALMLNRLTDMGLGYSVQRYASSSTDLDEQSRILSYVTKVKLIGCLLIAVVGIISYQWISSVLHFTNPFVILVAFALQSCTVLYEHLQSALQAFHRFWQLILINVVQSSAKLGGTVVLLFSGVQSATGLLSWHLITPLLPVLAFFVWLPRGIKINFSNSFQKEKTLMTSMAKHSAIMFISAGVIENIDILFVQNHLNTYEAGLLGGMTKISTLFMLIAYSLGNVLNPRVARYKEYFHLHSFLKKSWLLVLISALGFCVAILISKYLVLFTIGAEYLAGLSVLNVLIAASFVAVATMPFMAIFFSVEEPWYFSFIGILQLIITIGGNLIFLPEFGLQATAWTRLITKLIAFIVSVFLAYSMVKKHYATANT